MPQFSQRDRTARFSLTAIVMLLSPLSHAQVNVPPPPFGGVDSALTIPYTGDVLGTFSLFSLRNMSSVVRSRLIDRRLLMQTRQLKTAERELGVGERILVAAAGGTIPLPAGDTSAASPWGTFATVTFDRTDKKTTFTPNGIGEIGFDNRYTTLAGGGDYRLSDQWLAGAAFSLGRAKATLSAIANPQQSASAGDITANVGELSAYGTWTSDGWYMDSFITLATLRFNTNRTILIGAGQREASGNTNGLQTALGASAGYDWRVGENTFSPYVRAEALRVVINGYDESGSNGFDARLPKQTRDSLQLALGARYTRALSLDIGVVVPQISAELIHELRDGTKALVATPLSPLVPAFPAYTSDKPDRSFATLTLGATGQFANGWSGFAQAEHYIGLNNFKKTLFKIGVQKEL